MDVSASGHRSLREQQLQLLPLLLQRFARLFSHACEKREYRARQRSVVRLHRPRKKVYIPGVCPDEEVSSRWVTDRTLKTGDLREYTAYWIQKHSPSIGTLYIDHILKPEKTCVSPFATQNHRNNLYVSVCCVCIYYCFSVVYYVKSLFFYLLSLERGGATLVVSVSMYRIHFINMLFTCHFYRGIDLYVN